MEGQSYSASNSSHPTFHSRIGEDLHALADIFLASRTVTFAGSFAVMPSALTRRGYEGNRLRTPIIFFALRTWKTLPTTLLHASTRKPLVKDFLWFPLGRTLCPPRNCHNSSSVDKSRVTVSSGILPKRNSEPSLKTEDLSCKKA